MSRVTKHKFSKQRCHARERGIEWQLTYEQWLAIWGDKLPLRGRRRGQYVMARKGDTGPYSIGNVRAVTCTENASSIKKRLGDDNHASKLASSDVKRIRSLLAGGHKQTEVARMYGVTPSNVSRIATGDIWSGS